MKKIIKSCVAMLLTLCLVLGMVPVMPASAAHTSNVIDINGDGKITYVSFGDSVTNGYGMADYRYEDGSNVYGFRRAPEKSYPFLVKKDLEKQGYEVELVQMAISGFRMDDLAWMLNDNYVPDGYHYYWFDDWNERLVNAYANKHPEFAAKYSINGYVHVDRANEIVMAEYREAVKNADLITIDLGTNNFGTFMTNTVLSILGMKELEYEIDFTQYMDAKTAASLEEMLGQMVANMVGGSDTIAYKLAMELARCLMFGYLGYTDNYDLALEGLYQINPDAQVVVIDCYSMITGVDLAGGALGENVDLDQLYNMFIDLANFYSRELSPFAHKVTHATLDSAPELFIDYYKDYPDAKYPNNQYLDPNAERLMNEFLMEAMGKNADSPEDRVAFQEELLDKIQMLDSYINNLSAIVDENVISGIIDPQIKTKLDPVVALVNSAIDGVIAAKGAVKTAADGVVAAEAAVEKAVAGVQTATGAVDAAIDGVTTAADAVETAQDGVAKATEAVNTAVEGANSAQSMVNMIVEKVVGNSMFSTSSFMKSIVISTIKSNLQDMDLTAYGYSSDDIDALADEIYKVACDYKNTSDKTTANKNAVIEIIRFNLTYKMAYSEEEAIATANQAWEMNEIVELQGKPAAVKAAIATAVTDDLMALLGVDNDDAAAELIYTLGTLEEAEAIKAAIELKLDNDTLVLLGTSDKKTAAAIVYNLGTIGTTDKTVAIKEAIKLKLDNATLEMLGISDKDTAAAVVYNLGTIGATDELAAVKEAIKLKLDNATLEMLGTTDKDVAAEFIYTIGKMEDKDAAVKAVLMFKLKNEDTVHQALDLYTVYEVALDNGADDAGARGTAVVAAMISGSDYTGELAEAIYAVYSDKANATYAQKKLAYVTLMTNQKVGDVTITKEMAEAIFACYAGIQDAEGNVISLDGKYENEIVQSVIQFFMVYLVIADTTEMAAELYGQYLMYKGLPVTLSKIAKCDTIYFDALLAGKPDLGAVVERFKTDDLALDKPEKSEAEDPEAWAKYKSDSALATLYFRFMTQEGIFTHPSEAGQEQLFKAAQKAINSILVPEADRSIEVNADTKLLVLGDFVTADTNTSYVKTIADKLGVQVENLSNKDFRINDIRAILDTTYEKDAYAKEVIPNALDADYAKAVKDSDVIILNYGSMNMGLIAKQLGTFMVDGSTYSMEFSNLENMKPHNLGATMDGFLNNFSGAFGKDAIGALMLAFESYGYGFSTFADSMAATVEKIQELNSEADIVLVGMYDLLGDAYIADPSGLHLELGHFIGHAVNLMNQRMEIYADMTGNVTYVDVADVETKVKEQHNLLASGVAGIAEAFANAVPTADGYAEMAQRITCAMGLHEAEKAEDISWEWIDNTVTRAAERFAAKAKFHCAECDEDVTVSAKITVSETAPTCTESGCRTYTASYGEYACPETKTETLDPINHDYKPSWNWNTDFTEATLVMTCANDTAHVLTVKGAISTTTTDAKCDADGKIVYTATATFEGTTYTDQKQSVIPSSGHSWSEWTQTKDPTCEGEGEQTRECSCGVKETRPVSATGHSYESTVIAPTCEEVGYTSYICANCGDSYADNIKEATGHSYGEDSKCTVCGEIDPDAHPVCEYRVNHALESGKTYILSLGGSDVGSYTFNQVSGGWTIQGADGKYLAIEDQALVSSASAFTWTYSNNMFSAVVKGSSSSNNWWGGIFGGGWWGSGSSNKDTTYYLVASGNSASISTSSNGAVAVFYTNEADFAHDFDDGVVTAPTCEDGGYTTYTCERCGYAYNGAHTSASGHDYKATVTAPTCDEEGFTTYTCSKCGDSYEDNTNDALGHQYETTVVAPTCDEKGYTEYTCSVCGDEYKEDFVDALGHDFQDGFCSVCGDAEEPEHPLCQYRVEETLKDGLNPLLNIGGQDLGYFIFTKNGSGWNIIDENDQYLALEDSKLIRSNAPFAWTYSSNTFSTKVTTQSSGSSNNWWGGIFGGGWGSSNSTTTTYYLVASNGAPAISTSSSGATVKLYSEWSGDHFFMDPVSRDGSHVFICENCGYEYAEPCTDAECELCHPAVPEAKINVSVSVTSTSSGSSWFDRFFGSSTKTYTASISVTAEGTEVESVAYSTNGGTIWAEGTSFTSSSNITNFDIRVIATNGETYYFTYNNGTVTQK